MRPAAGLSLVLALAACERPAQPAPGPAAKPPAVAPSPADDWAFGMGKNSVELVHLVGGDPKNPDLRLVCAAGQGFLILLPGLKPVASEERLTIGADAIAHVLAATAATTGVQARGPISDELLSVLAAKAPIGVNHGYQNAGPFSPPTAMRLAFADRCRALRSHGQV